MSVIGTFSKSPDGYAGAIRTMTINVKAKIVANDKNGNDKAPDFRIIAIDNSQAMIERCREIVAGHDNIELELADICDVPIENASMVVMNYTLQFLDLDVRDLLIARICEGLVPGGLFVLSEKVVDEDLGIEELLAGGVFGAGRRLILFGFRRASRRVAVA